MRICPFCNFRVYELKVVAVYLNSQTHKVISTGRYWCEHCDRPMRKTIFRSNNGNGHRKTFDRGLVEDENGAIKFEDFVDSHSLARDRKISKNSNVMSFIEFWTWRRSKPPQQPRYKDVRQMKDRDYFGWGLNFT
jgi:hypothetical protein